MSTLENALEMEGCAQYMVACETTSPNLGMTGRPGAFKCTEPRAAALALAALYIARNDEAYRRESAEHGDDPTKYPSAYPTDVAVTDLSLITLVAQQLASVWGTSAQFGTHHLLWDRLVIPDNPEFPFYDLPQARDAVILRRFTEQKIDAPDHAEHRWLTGMSWCLDPTMYTDRGHDYDNLRIARYIKHPPKTDQSQQVAPESPLPTSDQPCL